MAEYTITKKQNLIDACIQVYGTTQLLFKFANDNGLSIDSDVNVGDVLIYDDSDMSANLNIVEKINNNNLNIINPNV